MGILLADREIEGIFFFFLIGGGESVEIFVLTFSLKSFKSSGVGNGNLLQYSCLENSMEHGGLYNPWGHKESDVTKHSLTLKSFIPVVHQKEGVLKEVTFALVSGLEVVKLGVCLLSALSEVICCYSFWYGVKFSSLSQIFKKSLPRLQPEVHRWRLVSGNSAEMGRHCVYPQTEWPHLNYGIMS